MQCDKKNRDEYFFRKFKIYSNIKIRFSKKLKYESYNIEDGYLTNIKFQVKYVTIPLIIYYGVGNIEVLNYIKIEKSLLTRIKFYLVEPLTTYSADSKQLNWYNEYSKNEEHLIRSKELDSIDDFCQRHNLKNVKVYSPEFNIENIFSSKYPNLIFKTKSLVYPFSRNDRDANISPERIQKKFWCGNNRYSSHRHIITSYLISTVPREELNISWLRDSKIENIEKNINLNYFHTRKNLIINGVEKLDQVSPISFDLRLSRKLEIDEKFEIDWKMQNPVKSYQESFCSIINETRFFQSTTTISEKILNAIFNKQFFIIVAPPYTLKYLKLLGFKTFNEWIDESYDDETCHEKRLDKIFNLIDYINSMNINDCKLIQLEMKEVLLHNYRHSTSQLPNSVFLQKKVT